MTITPKTTVHTLLKEHPFLLDFLAGYNPEFKKLTNPVLRRTMGRMATLETVAEHGQRARSTSSWTTSPPRSRRRPARDPTIADNADAETIDPARSGGTARRSSRTCTPASRSKSSRRASSELIEDVEADGDRRDGAEAHRGRRRPTPRSSASATSTCRCSRDALDGHEPVKVAGRAPHRHLPAREPGPAAGDGSRCARSPRRSATPPDVREEWERLKPALGGVLDRLLEIDRHYLRKENQLFPFLEKHGVEGPSKVMWAIHDDIRALMKQARAALADDEAALAVSTAQASWRRWPTTW